MSKLVTKLLELARADQTEQTLKLEPVCLSALTERTLLSAETMLYEKGIELRQQIEAEVSVNADPDKAEQVLGILLDNACKYTNAGGTVEVSLLCRKKHAVLTVANTGEGIAPEHIDKIFDRFYRVDDARKHTGSYGLGLPIAKSLVEQMGGSISVSSAPQQKTIFTVRMATI